MTKQGNFRVIVEPDEPWGSATDEKWRSNCNQIIADIQRHVDGFIQISWESDTLCGFCDSIWEVQTYNNVRDQIPKGQPLCCEEAMKEWEEQQREREEQQHEKGE